MADDDTPPPDVNTPDLTMNDKGWPLAATGDAPGGTPPSGAPPVVPDFSVTVQTLRDAQTFLLPTVETAVNSYNTLKASTNDQKDWIFQQGSPGDLGQYYFWNPASQGTQTENVQPDPDLAAQTPKMVASLDNALLAIADVVHLTGEYASYMNVAAQAYTSADKGSFLPTS